MSKQPTKSNNSSWLHWIGNTESVTFYYSRLIQPTEGRHRAELQGCYPKWLYGHMGDRDALRSRKIKFCVIWRVSLHPSTVIPFTCDVNGERSNQLEKSGSLTLARLVYFYDYLQILFIHRLCVFWMVTSLEATCLKAAPSDFLSENFELFGLLRNVPDSKGKKLHRKLTRFWDRAYWMPKIPVPFNYLVLEF